MSKDKSMMGKLKGFMTDEETEIIDTQELEIDETFDVNVNSSEVKKDGRNIVKIYEPVSKVSAERIMDSIKKYELCLVNFKNMSEEESNQVLNQLSGTIYALDGKLVQMTGEIIVCAPKTYLVNEENN